MVSHMLEVFGTNVGIGYDIGCSFKKTVEGSSRSLASSANERGMRFVVPSFHGYAHNRICQLSHHLLYVSSFGLEDVETCECVFSAFNGLAPITHCASAFHRHQAIDLFAEQWDNDKYQELCMCINL
jgi:Kyakuja-Dileera-Zisupton transposase